MRLIIAIMVAILIAGCSPRVFVKETAGFRDAATGVETAWIGLHDKVDALRQAERDRIRDDWEFSVSKQCAKFASDLARPPKADLDEAASKAALNTRRKLIEDCTLFRRQADQPALGVFVDPVDRRLQDPVPG